MGRSPAVAWTIPALILAVGIAFAGWSVGRGVVEARTGDRVVSVKGLAEREVKSDLAIWPLRFVANGDDLAVVQAEIRGSAEKVRAFLASHGLASHGLAGQSLTGETVRTASVDVVDMLAQTYQTGTINSRFIVSMTLIARTTDVDAVDGAAADLASLLEAGVVLASDYGPQGNKPAFIFTRLGDLKAEMLQQATANAREAARQFAADSQSTVGPIKSASQGVFQITPRDPAPGAGADDQVMKTVRVVSTIDYFLVD